MLDPPLTVQGEQQARELAQHLLLVGHTSQVIVSSPLRRALQTASLGCWRFLENGAQVVAQPLSQETSNVPCDTGQDVASIRGLFTDQPINLDAVELAWNSKTGKWSQDDEAVKQRAADLREWLSNLPAEELTLVTHGFFIHYLTEDGSDLEKHGTCSDHRLLNLMLKTNDSLQGLVSDIANYERTIWSRPGSAMRSAKRKVPKQAERFPCRRKVPD